MSDVSVDIIKNRSGEAPDLPSGANLSGVSTAVDLQVTNLNPTHINASGVTTATTFSGSLKSTGTPTLGLGVTINSSGVAISGVATAGIVSATTLYGNGENLTGVAFSIAPISYNPDVGDTVVQKSGGGIGITFTERVIAGSGNVTLRIAGAAGTVVENFGVGSSVTISNNEISFTPTAALLQDTVYHINYPSGAFTNTAGDVSYVGTAYTFTAAPTSYELWVWGNNAKGQLGQNSVVLYSSPVQIPGTTWKTVSSTMGSGSQEYIAAIKTDGTLWTWGKNSSWGNLGVNNRTEYSSPVQVPGTTWALVTTGDHLTMATKTDGTLWSWGYGGGGNLGQNSIINVSSPVQIPGTNWSISGKNKFIFGANVGALAIKNDGTLWSWGKNQNGYLGLNSPENSQRSSPVQIPGTTWSSVSKASSGASFATKTDGTLWSWGYASVSGQLGHNSTGTHRSSPTQIPGTSWSTVSGGYYVGSSIRTDGTLWNWGSNQHGTLGNNNRTQYSSPIQIPGTTWNQNTPGYFNAYGIKTDGTLWSWGRNQNGALGQNNEVSYSSPVQIPGTNWSTDNNVLGANHSSAYVIKEV